MKRFVLLPVLCVLAACGGGDADRAPGNVTPDEAKALGEAAEMIDAQREPDGAAVPASSPTPVGSR